VNGIAQHADGIIEGIVGPAAEKTQLKLKHNSNCYFTQVVNIPGIKTEAIKIAGQAGVALIKFGWDRKGPLNATEL